MGDVLIIKHLASNEPPGELSHQSSLCAVVLHSWPRFRSSWTPSSRSDHQGAATCQAAVRGDHQGAATCQAAVPWIPAGGEEASAASEGALSDRLEDFISYCLDSLHHGYTEHWWWLFPFFSLLFSHVFIKVCTEMLFRFLFSIIILCYFIKSFTVRSSTAVFWLGLK